MLTCEPTAREVLLEGQVASLTANLKGLQEEVERLQQEKHVLRLKIDALSRKLFGRSSEKLNPDQLQLIFDTLAQEAAAACNTPAVEEPAAGDPGPDPAPAAPGPPPAPVRKKRSLAELIENLPSTTIVLTPPEVEAEPGAWRATGASEETKLLDYIPGHFCVRIILRPKYVPVGHPFQAPITAPLELIQDRCIATPRLLANTLVLRFEQHLPYYRIEQLYARAGVPLSRQTLCGWAGMAANASSIILALTREEVFADGYVQADETPVKYQDPARKGVCGTGYLWVFYNPVRNLCYFAWRTGRGADCLESIIPADYRGIIQCDGWKSYNRFVKDRAAKGHPIQLAGCMAHARRYFYDAKAEGEDALWVLLQMQKLYHIETRLRDSRAGPELIRTERQTHSLPILQQIKTRLDDLVARRKHLPQSLTGEAITYTLGQWDKLLVFLQDGRVRIDNNLVENAIRPSAIGKKNWLFMGDPKSGGRAALFYTLIGNCHRAGIDAQAYLTDLFTRLALPTQTTKSLRGLTPQGWDAAPKPAAPTGAA
jgi:transposase